MQKQKCGEFQKKRQQELKLSIENSGKRIADLDKLFNRIYEDNVIEKLSDERYARMAAEYESEQKELLEKVREEDGYLRVYDAENPEDIVERLMQNGHVVSEVRKNKIGLEEYYIELMSEKGEG